MTRIGLISDIHSNLEALEAILCDVSLAGVDTLACLGDITGYGPDPSACVDLVREACDVVVIGNHDEAVIDPSIADRFKGAAREAIGFNRDELGPDHRRYLGTLPELAEVGELWITHACFGPNKYEYLYGAASASEAFGYLPTRYGAVGHTHLPSSFRCCAKSAGRPDNITLESVIGRSVVDVPEGCRAIFNPGSVGQPRDRNPDASWGILDTEASTFQVRRVCYDVDAVQAKMVRCGLPVAHSDRLALGA